MQDGVDKVPLLGDIPLFGHLFRSETRQRMKTNLMVFLRPYVLRDTASADGVTSERYEFIRHKQAEFSMKPHFALPDMQMAPLPELKLPPLPESGRAVPPELPAAPLGEPDPSPTAP